MISRSTFSFGGVVSRAHAHRGFGLIELMVALALGVLLAAGITTLFGSTSKTNKLQDGMSRLQENGRYALTRIETDLRMLSGQYCSNFSGGSQVSANGPIEPLRAPEVYVGSVTLPDSAAPLTGAAPYPMSPRVFAQGYECSSGTCNPAVPSAIPTAGTAIGNRVQDSDVLTIRYQQGTGIPLSTTVPPSCSSGGTITLQPQTGDDAAVFTNTPKLAIISDCENPALVPIASVSGNVVTLGTVLPGGPGPFCAATANRDTRLFNFSDKFVTVTYDLEIAQDTNPDATNPKIGVLVRRENGTAGRQELIRGVDQLDFVYGVQDINGAVRYMKADEVNANSNAANCQAPPDGVALEAGCLWRSVKSVEVHVLLNTGTDVYGLSTMDQAYRHYPSGTIGVPPSSFASGLPVGSRQRREFVTLVSIRNMNF